MLTTLIVLRSDDNSSQYLQDFAENSAGVGMKIRISKSSIYSLRMDANDLIQEETREVLDSLAVVDPGASLSIIGPNEGTLVLSAPVGSDKYVRQKCEHLVEDLAVEMKLRHKIDTPQQYYLLLEKCFNAHAFHLAHWVLPDLLATAAVAHDKNVDALWLHPITGLADRHDPNEPQHLEVHVGLGSSTMFIWSNVVPAYFPWLNLPPCMSIVRSSSLEFF